jgi:transposase-like protein
MPPVCRVCQHPQKADIDKLLVNGRTSLRNIAEQFGTSATALHRHKQHLPKLLQEAKKADEVSQADNLLEEVRHLQNRAMDILTQAETTGDLRAALMGVREARSCLELCARIAGQIRDQNINLNQNLLVRIVVGQKLPQSVYGELPQSVYGAVPE